jgi:hypothetical protein
MKVDPAHAASEGVIKIVSAALREAPLVGLIHPIWAGPDPCAFANLEAYLERVRQSDPGFLFTLWSVPDLDRRGLLLLRGHSNDLRSIHDWLHAEQGREFLAVGIVGTAAMAVFGDADGFGELTNLARQADPCREFAILPLSDLWENGCYTPRLFLVNAECANARGEVPEGNHEAAQMKSNRW